MLGVLDYYLLKSGNLFVMDNWKFLMKVKDLKKNLFFIALGLCCCAVLC